MNLNQLKNNNLKNYLQIYSINSFFRKYIKNVQEENQHEFLHQQTNILKIVKMFYNIICQN